MNITLEEHPNCEVLVNVEIPADRVNSERQRITQSFAGQARIKGFRPGKAPMSVIEKRFGGEIQEELEDRLVSLGCHEAIKKHELDVLRVTEVEDKMFHPDSAFSFRAKLMTAPAFHLPDYKNIPVKVPRENVTDEDLDRALASLAEQFAEFADVEGRALQKEDFAVVDYQGTVEGAPILEAAPDAGKQVAEGEDMWLRMAEDGFLPGFTEQLEGASIGDRKTIELTLDEDFPVKPLAGKAVRYDVEVKGIKERKLPEIDEELAKKLMPGKSLDDLKETLHGQLVREHEEMVGKMKRNQVMEYLAGAVDFDLPEDLVNRETQSNIQDIVQSSQQRGVPPEELEKHKEDIFQSAAVSAKGSVKSGFLLGEIAREEKIEATSSEMAARVAAMAAHYKISEKKLVKQLKSRDGLGRIEHSIVTGKTLDFLVANASVEEVEPEPETEADPGQA